MVRGARNSGPMPRACCGKADVVLIVGGVERGVAETPPVLVGRPAANSLVVVLGGPIFSALRSGLKLNTQAGAQTLALGEEVSDLSETKQSAAQVFHLAFLGVTLVFAEQR